VVADGRLGNRAARREVARTHIGAACELTQDRQAGRVGRALEEQGIRVGDAFHVAYGIDK
jgi:hypothetical protein